MCNIQYSIINTGSDGNAVVLNDNILIDCGVSYKSIQPFIKSLKLVLLTHIHGDHFNHATIRRLAAERPTLRFGSGVWLTPQLVEAGVRKDRIDILSAGTEYNYGICKVIPVKLQHNVPNMGYKVHLPHGKIIYATDTVTLAGIEAKHYDLYLVEANYEDADIRERMREKEATGEYAYERDAMVNHLSKARCDAWIYQNIGRNGEYIYMHQHREQERSET